MLLGSLTGKIRHSASMEHSIRERLGGHFECVDDIDGCYLKIVNNHEIQILELVKNDTSD